MSDPETCETQNRHSAIPARFEIVRKRMSPKEIRRNQSHAEFSRAVASLKWFLTKLVTTSAPTIIPPVGAGHRVSPAGRTTSIG
jgi:hypothetical protein